MRLDLTLTATPVLPAAAAERKSSLGYRLLRAFVTEIVMEAVARRKISPYTGIPSTNVSLVEQFSY